MPDEPTTPVSRESLRRRHELSGHRVRNTLIIGFSTLALVIVCAAVCGATLRHFARARPMQSMRPLGLIIAPDLKPLTRFPRPNVQIDDDLAEMTSLRAVQREALNRYAWIDRSNGIVRIPIDRAMDLLLQRGLPMRTNAVPQTDGSPLQLIQKIPEQP